MFYGRLQPIRTARAVQVFLLSVAVVCLTAAEGRGGQTTAGTTPSPGKAGSQPASPTSKVANNPSPPGAAGNTAAMAAGAGSVSTSTPGGGGAQQTPPGGPLPANKTKGQTTLPPAKVVHNPSPPRKPGQPAGEAREAGADPLKTAPPSDAAAGRRDPFKPWVMPSSASHPVSESEPLPPGTHGLVISGLRFEGIVRLQPANTMIAVVTNYTKRAYFLRVNDAVYNGVVSKITPEAIYFNENILDSRGRVATQEVEIKLGSAPGEGR